MFGESYIPPEARGEQSDVSENEANNMEAQSEAESTIPRWGNLSTDEKIIAWGRVIDSIKNSGEAKNPETGEPLLFLSQEQATAFVKEQMGKFYEEQTSEQKSPAEDEINENITENSEQPPEQPEIEFNPEKKEMFIENPNFETYARDILVNAGQHIKQMAEQDRMTKEQVAESEEEIEKANVAFDAGELNNSDLVEVISKYASTTENEAKAKLDKVTREMLDTDSMTQEGRNVSEEKRSKISELRANYDQEIAERFKLAGELRELSSEQIEKVKYNKAFEGLLSEVGKLEDEPRILALSDLALDRARSGRFDQIEQIINTFSDAKQKDQFCIDLIDSLLREGNIPYENLEKIAENIDDAGLKKEWSTKIGEVKLRTIASALNRVASGQNIEAERKQLGMDLRGNLDKISKSSEMQTMSAEYGSAAGWVSQQAQDKDRALELLGIKAFGLLKHGGEKLGLNKTSTEGKIALAGFGLMWLFCFSIEKGIQLIKNSMEKAGVKFPQYAKRAIEGQGKKQSA